MMATTLRETIADDNNTDDKVTTMAMISFFQATTNLGWMHSWQRGWVGDFYDDDDNENDKDGNNDEDNHRCFLFTKVLPMQSTAMTTVRTTT